MKVESGKFYFIKDKFFDVFKGYKLMENKEKVVSRETLMTKLWESDNYVDENTLSVNVNRLRKKLEALGLEEFILTKKGIGYRLG